MNSEAGPQAKCEPTTAYATLAQAQGIVSTTAIYEKEGSVPELLSAFHCVVLASDAVQQLMRLLAEGSSAGQLYALVGLKAVDAEQFEHAVAQYHSIDTPVVLLGGDIDTTQPTSEIAEQVARGEYAALLPEKYAPPLREGGWVRPTDR